MRRSVPFLLGAASLLASASVLLPSPAQAATRTYRATVSGANEVPPTSSTGSGTVTLTIDDVANRVCAELTLQGLDIGLITAMHIHRGPAGVNGPIIVNFTPGASACTEDVPAATVDAIVADPAGHYFNAHTAANPGGEVRGQLTEVTEPGTTSTTSTAPTTSTSTTTTRPAPPAAAPRPVPATPRFTG